MKGVDFLMEIKSTYRKDNSDIDEYRDYCCDTQLCRFELIGVECEACTVDKEGEKIYKKELARKSRVVVCPMVHEHVAERESYSYKNKPNHDFIIHDWGCRAEVNRRLTVE